jgi:hypothetical protein
MARAVAHAGPAGRRFMEQTREQRCEARTAQLDRFCAKHGLDRAQAVAGGGYRKEVIMFPEEVYCLPFSAASAIFVEREHAFFKCYHGKLGVEIPRSIRSFRDEEFCQYEIGVISRVKGDLYPVMEGMDWPATREVFISFAEAAAGWHAAQPDAELLSRHGTSFADLSPVPIMNRWLSWLLKTSAVAETVAWAHGLLLEAVKKEVLDPSFIERPATIKGWHRAFSELSNLEPVVLHADMHDGQIVLRPGTSVISGVIDWDNFCLGNPLVDFNTSKWFPDRMWLFRKDFHEMRVEMWRRYLGRRGIKGLWSGGLSLFCLMTEAVRVVREKECGRIWMTKGPYRAALQEYVQYLEAASRGIVA